MKRAKSLPCALSVTGVCPRGVAELDVAAHRRDSYAEMVSRAGPTDVMLIVHKFPMVGLDAQRRAWRAVARRSAQPKMAALRGEVEGTVVRKSPL